MNTSRWFAAGGVVLALLGWAAIIGVATFMPGGHPPLVAYVALPIIVLLLPINLVGLLLAVRSGWREAATGQRMFDLLVVLGNLGFLITGAVILLGF